MRAHLALAGSWLRGVAHLLIDFLTLAPRDTMDTVMTVMTHEKTSATGRDVNRGVLVLPKQDCFGTSTRSLFWDLIWGFATLS